jgi:hypothetical protein
MCLLQFDLKLFPKSDESADPESSSESECLLSFGFECGGCFRFLEQFAKPDVTAEIIFRIKCFFRVLCCVLELCLSIVPLPLFPLVPPSSDADVDADALQTDPSDPSDSSDFKSDRYEFDENPESFDSIRSGL